jgi:hypothetical protein
MPATYEPIATTTLGSAAASITFSSIAATYTDLRIVFVAITSGGSSRIRFNSDIGSNYSRTYVVGDGSAAASSLTNNSSQIFMSYGGSPVNTIPYLHQIDIFSYAGSTNKTILWDKNLDLNGSGDVIKGVGLWRNTSAITAIELSNNGGNLLAGTTATLYGIKNA